MNPKPNPKLHIVPPHVFGGDRRMKIADIKVGKRIRKDMGDLTGLAESIEDLGLLHPIVVFPDGRLILGERRLRAAKLLGWETIPVTIVRDTHED
jgi:ParB family transcriptional regulator, chromosome partitioning protein